jgi:hypothetical protein
MSSILEQELVDKPCEPAPALRLIRQGALTRARQFGASQRRAEEYLSWASSGR